MSEPQATPAVEPQHSEPQVDATPSGLPSDVVTNEVSYDGFQLNDEQKSDYRNGKFKGRFESIDDILGKLKEAEDRNANLIREHKDEATTTQAEADKVQASTDTQMAQQQAILDMVPEFKANGMQLTPEMEQRAVDAGIDIRDLKIGAMEMRDRANAAHKVVGGAEEYTAMLDWGKANMSDSQKQAFDNDVTGGMSEYAIKGLHSDYKQALSEGTYTPRIEGDSTVHGIKPYADRRELYKDRDYVQSRAGQRDTTAVANYKARLNATPNSILGIQ